MASNTYPQKPNWLTDEIINSLKEDLKICSNPYTKEEIDNIPLDGYIDIERANAKTAKDILAKYGLL